MRDMARTKPTARKSTGRTQGRANLRAVAAVAAADVTGRLTRDNLDGSLGSSEPG